MSDAQSGTHHIYSFVDVEPILYEPHGYVDPLERPFSFALKAESPKNDELREAYESIMKTDPRALLNVTFDGAERRMRFADGDQPIVSGDKVEWNFVIVSTRR